MRSFFEWFGVSGLDRSTPWVILGKGPSFSKRDDYRLNDFHTFALNHAVRELPVTVAHMIDLDVVDALGEVLEKQARHVVMPWIPHVHHKPGERNLAELALVHPVLRRLDAENRLLWYNLSTARWKRAGSPVVEVTFFSAEAALNLLGMAGVPTVRSLGVDGGVSYGKEFEDLRGKTLLANGQATFDRQFEKMAEIMLRTGVRYAPLDVDFPVRIYVGATEAQMLPVRVLEYSIRKHASVSVEVMPLHRAGIPIPSPQFDRNRPRTPFSFQRFLIPAAAGFQGRALYLDSDMQVFRDIRALWSSPFGGAEVLCAEGLESDGRRPQFSVMLLDCGRLRWNIDEIVKSLDEGRLTYEQLMHEMKVAERIRAGIPAAWNSLEAFIREETALLHYTDLPTQPWLSADHPLGHLWMHDLIEAVDRGFIAAEEVREHVRRGHVRPSLLAQVERGIRDGTLMAEESRRLDRFFIPPHAAPRGAGEGKGAA